MPVKWRKQMIAAESFEAAAVLDVDGDGIPDIVSGSFWYQGPEFKRRFCIGDVPRVDEYYDDFSALPIDAGDGTVWLATGGWWGGTLRCRRVAPTGPWQEHVIAETTNIEATRMWDVDRDGQNELVPNTPNGPLAVYKPLNRTSADGVPEFETHQLWHGKQGHGLGFGDISGSGRGDFVMNHGWLEAPEDTWNGSWTYHPEFQLPRDSSVPIIVTDLDGDGVTELIVGHGHSYGLEWWSQHLEDDGHREWKRHVIDSEASQFHDLLWVDIDGDGSPELLTGKRWRAHPNDTDQGAYDDIGLYYYKWNGEIFEKFVISYGPLGTGVGTGISFATADLTGDGSLDIIAPGKDGLHVLFNEGQEQ